MSTDGEWEPLSAAAAELIRGVCTELLDDLDPIYELIDRAVLDSAPERLLADPGLTAATAAVNHTNLRHWISSNATAPGEPVRANLTSEVLDLARDIVRRGFDDTALNSYRVGQNAAFQILMEAVFELADDLDLVRELLAVLARSIFGFVDDTLEGIQQQMDLERDQLTSGTHAERLEFVNLILEGAPIGIERASSRLGYELRGDHRAAVLWSDEADSGGALAEAAEGLARAAGARRPFSVVASARSLWVWVRSNPDVDEADLIAALPVIDGVRIALGPSAGGLEGFRRSHLDALSTQRLMHRMAVQIPVASYRDIELVVLAAADEQRAGEFVRSRLGEFTDADPRLTETVRTYIREQFNTTATAQAMTAHRNTIISRLEKARDLLPGPLEGNGLEVGVALEIHSWLGSGSLRSGAPGQSGAAPPGNGVG